MTELDLGKAILDEMGISMLPDHTLIEQDTMQIMRFQDKTMKYSVNDPNIYIGEQDIKFDPIHNYAMMDKMLGRYLDKETEDGNITVVSIFNGNEQCTKRSTTGVKCAGGVIESRPYNNKCLSICDTILQFANMQSDLTEFDEER